MSTPTPTTNNNSSSTSSSSSSSSSSIPPPAPLSHPSAIYLPSSPLPSALHTAKVAPDYNLLYATQPLLARCSSFLAFLYAYRSLSRATPQNKGPEYYAAIQRVYEPHIQLLFQLHAFAQTLPKHLVALLKAAQPPNPKDASAATHASYYASTSSLLGCAAYAVLDAVVQLDATKDAKACLNNDLSYYKRSLPPSAIGKELFDLASFLASRSAMMALVQAECKREGLVLSYSYSKRWVWEDIWSRVQSGDAEKPAVPTVHPIMNYLYARAPDMVTGLELLRTTCEKLHDVVAHKNAHANESSSVAGSSNGESGSPSSSSTSTTAAGGNANGANGNSNANGGGLQSSGSVNSNLDASGQNQNQNRKMMYERIGRYNYDAAEKESIVRTLWGVVQLKRHLEAMYRRSGADEMRQVRAALETAVFQDARYYLFKAMKKNKEEATALTELVSLLSWPRDDWEWQSQKKNKEPKAPFIVHTSTQGAPDAILYMIALTLQHILSREKVYKKLKTKYFQPLRKIGPLLERYFVLRQYESLLASYGDVSFFWYREFFLDLEQRPCFPIAVSIPYILIEMVLENTRLMDYIDGPLEVYKTAVEKALLFYRRKHMVNEILVEKKVVEDSVVFYLSRCPESLVREMVLRDDLKKKTLALMNVPSSSVHSSHSHSHSHHHAAGAENNNATASASGMSAEDAAVAMETVLYMVESGVWDATSSAWLSREPLARKARVREVPRARAALQRFVLTDTNARHMYYALDAPQRCALLDALFSRAQGLASSSSDSTSMSEDDMGVLGNIVAMVALWGTTHVRKLLMTLTQSKSSLQNTSTHSHEAAQKLAAWMLGRTWSKWHDGVWMGVVALLHVAGGARAYDAWRSAVVEGLRAQAGRDMLVVQDVVPPSVESMARTLRNAQWSERDVQAWMGATDDVDARLRGTAVDPLVRMAMQVTSTSSSSNNGNNSGAVSAVDVETPEACAPWLRSIETMIPKA